MKLSHILAVTISMAAFVCSCQAPPEIPQQPAAKPAASEKRGAASHILISYKGSKNKAKKVSRTKEEALAKAKEILVKLRSGEDFAKMAKEHSDCSSASRGGELGTLLPGRMPPAFVKGVRPLKVGEISEPVESPLGYHIFKREEPVAIEMLNASIIAVLHKDSQPNPVNATRSREEALARSLEALAKLKEGADFGEVAVEYSEHPSKEMGGLMGNFRSDRVPLEILRGVKALNIGQFSSEPNESPLGFYIFKRSDIAVPVAISLILLTHKDSEPNQLNTTHTKEEAFARAKGIISKLEGGAKFADMAKEYSDHHSKARGGNLGSMLSDVLPSHIMAVVNLLKIGEFSKEPFDDPVGYYIFLRNDPTKIKPWNVGMKWAN